MTNRDEARERLAAALAMADRYGTGGVQFGEGPDGVVNFDDVRALLSTEEVGGSDQPLPSVATGHPEQGALLSGWQEIESAPDSPMGVLFFVPGARRSELVAGHDYSLEVGFWGRSQWREQGTGHEINERSVAFGGNGDAMPTHWMPLPAPPFLPADGDGRVPSSTTDASRAPGTNNNNAAKRGE